MSAKTSTATRPKTARKNGTDWDRLRNMSEEEIEAAAASDPDNPPTDREFWRDARTVHPGSPRWQVVPLHLDVDVLEWFKARHFRYQDEINEALRAYMEAHRDRK
jgi:uncharacterized protein (DUF4415 family)